MHSLFFLLALLTLGFGVQASVQHPDGYKIVSEDRIEDYRSAVRSALNQNKMVTAACRPEWIHQTLNWSYEILVKQDKTQPLLIFNAFFSGATVMERLVFTTDVSMKQIVQVSYEYYRLGEVNLGDLSDPNIVEDYVLQRSWNCTKTP